MIGLSGPHRCGKTTLGDALAQDIGVPFVRTSAAEVFSLLNKDPKANYPIEERLAIQEAILFAFEKQYALAREYSAVFVSDRTPLDLAAYMLCDVQRATLAGMHPEVATLVTNYVRRCIDATNRWFSTVVLVQPGIALVEADGKAPCCPAYIEHMKVVLKGLMLDERLGCRHYVIPSRYVHLDDRVASVKQAVSHSHEAVEKQRRMREAAGVALH